MEKSDKAKDKSEKSNTKADKASDESDKSSDKPEANSKANKANDNANAPTYYDALENSLLNDWRVLIRSDKPNYIDDCADLLRFLTKNNGLNVILIAFDENTPKLVKLLREKGVDLSKISIIDSLLICSGVENHYDNNVRVHRSGSFSDLEVHTYLQLKRFDFRDACVLLIALDKLGDYANQNDVGCFLQVFGKQMEEFGIPMIMMIHPIMDMNLLMVFTRYVGKIIPFRAARLVKK